MKTLVIYDTLYGYTEKIAQAIGAALEGEVKVVKVGDAVAGELADFDFIFIGSPTQGGRHTKPLQAFLKELPTDALKNKKAAAFDTRMKSFWVKPFGWAANHIAAAFNILASRYHDFFGLILCTPWLMATARPSALIKLIAPFTSQVTTNPN